MKDITTVPTWESLQEACAPLGRPIARGAGASPNQIRQSPPKLIKRMEDEHISLRVITIGKAVDCQSR